MQAKKNGELTTSALKKLLKDTSAEQLREMITDLYSASPSARRIINLRLQGEKYEAVLLEQYMKKMDKIFLHTNPVYAGMPIGEAKQIMKEYLAYAISPEFRAEIQMYFVECGIIFTNTYGDIDSSFYSTLEKVFRDVIEAAIKDKKIFEKMEPRLEQAVYDTSGIGWGFHDELKYEYNRLLQETDLGE